MARRAMRREALVVPHCVACAEFAAASNLSPCTPSLHMDGYRGARPPSLRVHSRRRSVGHLPRHEVRCGAFDETSKKFLAKRCVSLR